MEAKVGPGGAKGVPKTPKGSFFFEVSDTSLDPHDDVKRSALDPGEPVAAYLKQE